MSAMPLNELTYTSRTMFPYFSCIPVKLFSFKKVFYAFKLHIKNFNTALSFLLSTLTYKVMNALYDEIHFFLNQVLNV